MRVAGWVRRQRGLGTVALVVVLLAIAAAAACGNSSSSEPSTQGGAPTSSTGQGDFQPVTVTDCTGVTATFTSPPKRVANLTRATLEMMFWLGVQDSIIGTQAPPPGALPPQFDAAAQRITSLSGPYEAGSFKPVAKEALLGANPDFVIGGFTSNFDAPGAAPQRDLTQLGIKSYFAFSTACTSALSAPQTNLDLVYRDLDNLGKIFGVQQRAADLISQMKTRVETVQNKIRSDGSRPSVFVFDYEEGTAQLAVSGNRQTINAVIELAGGRNAFGDLDKAFGTTGWEEVIKRNPDVILLSIVGGPTAADEKAKAEKAKQFLMTYAPIQNLPAVKDQRFVELIDGFGAIGGFRNAEGVEIVARALHPAAVR